MTDIFHLATQEEIDRWEQEARDNPPSLPHYDVHCLCGRFAKYLGGRNYYNGWYDCYSFEVDCKRCGTVTIECV